MNWRDFGEDDIGPQTPVATMVALRYLGNPSYFLDMAKVEFQSQKLQKFEYDRLVQMLTCNNGDEYDHLDMYGMRFQSRGSAVNSAVAASNPQSRALSAG